MIRDLNANLLIGAFVALVIAVVVTFGPSREASVPPFTVRSDDANGTMVLSMWLREAGFDVREVLSKPIQLDEIDVLIVVEPFIAYSEPEIKYITEWVQRGNTLIASGEPWIINDLLDAYDMSLSFLSESVDVVSPAGPTMILPPFDEARFRTQFYIETAQENVITHLASGKNALLVSFSAGQGKVWVSASVEPFTNRGLRDPGSARLILNMLAHVAPGSVIGFDEARHGLGSTDSVFGWLVGTPPGWGILSGVILTMIFLGLRGRRFGKAVPLPDERLRREPVEYIRAMASLFRRSGQRSDILAHYRQQLRRRLCDRYGIDPSIDDVELVKIAVVRDPAIDETDLRNLLKRLQSSRISETDLVRTALDMDNFLRKIM
jgi:hypothetical protein